MSTFSDVLNVLPEAVVKTLRLIEKTKKKIVNTNWSLIFNKTCLNENIWPTYTNLFNYINLIKKTSNFLIHLLISFK